MKYYTAQYVLTEKGLEEKIYLGVENSKIKDLIKEKPTDGEIIDFGDKIISPGFFDTHIHGYKNHDIMDCQRGALEIISEGILENGVTSFLPTTLTASEETLAEAVKVVYEDYKKVNGAKIRGIFLEGPFFTEKYKGAQNPSYMSAPSIDKLKHWLDASGGLVKKIAIAPEMEGVEKFTKEAKDLGVYVALGHSDATYEQAEKAVKAGANIFVHTYNAMSPLHHRNPGMVGAALSLDETYAEIIADGHHVHPAAIKVILNSKDEDKAFLVTDCMKAGGMPDGDYMLGEFPVVVKDGTARLLEGNLAGSILKLDQAVRNLVSWDIAEIERALRMASEVPARSLNMQDEFGILKQGNDADFIVLSKNLNVEQVYIDGILKLKK